MFPRKTSLVLSARRSTAMPLSLRTVIAAASRAVEPPLLFPCPSTADSNSVCECMTLQSGGSIGIWQKYFGTGLTMYGMDINPYCKVGTPAPTHSDLDAACSQSARTTAIRLSCDHACHPCASAMCITAHHSNCSVWEDSWNFFFRGQLFDCALESHNRSCLRTRRG